MVKIIWTEQAVDDLDAICLFISRDSFHYANIFAQKIIESIERLQYVPLSGRIVPEFKDKQVREIIYGSYRIIYKVKINAVEILTIHHSAQLLF